ncbi:AraC family transcriptional regulator, partial [Streptomyces sp. TRM76130]|nr:AraC family transcriptional regulator [Streptomyces sp. TRM76130]
MAHDSSQPPRPSRTSRTSRPAPPHRVVVIVDEGTNPFEVGCATELFGLPRPELGLPGPLYEVTLCGPAPAVRM